MRIMQLFSQPIYKYLLTFIQIRRPSLRNEEPTVISYVWCYGMSVAYFVRNTGHWILLINRKTYCKSLARLNISHLYVAYFWKCKSYLRSKKFVTRAVLISNISLNLMIQRHTYQASDEKIFLFDVGSYNLFKLHEILCF